MSQVFVEILPDASRRALISLAERSGDASGRIDSLVAEEASALVERIRARWPVDTGFSKALWSLARVGRMDFAVVNRAVYAGYVHRAGETTPLVDTMVVAEIQRTIARIERRVKALLPDARGLSLGRAARPASGGVLSAALRFLAGVGVDAIKNRIFK